jgi:hypothetical protein
MKVTYYTVHKRQEDQFEYSIGMFHEFIYVGDRPREFLYLKDAIEVRDEADKSLTDGSPPGYIKKHIVEIEKLDC